MTGFAKGGDGSSPRVRGTGPFVLPSARLQRFIPACAGNSENVPPLIAAVAVHPRVCGEQFVCPAGEPDKAGSSPRVRGTGPNQLFSCDRGRFIPACAGNRPTIVASTPMVTVHPRVCGEQNASRFWLTPSIGSSPRVRGTVRMLLLARRRKRFIPACAGNRGQRAISHFRNPVHPRVCGEQPTQSSSPPTTFGSSPRVRGTACRGDGWGLGKRFIPACAGNSAGSWLSRLHSPVHPRVCGEQCIRSGILMTSTGSSPRVRGTVRHHAGSWLSRRFIPACAGNRPSAIASAAHRPVHPRVCGEQLVKRVVSLLKFGSSPRVRGTGRYNRRRLPLSRFIPACAGNRKLNRSKAFPISVHPRVCGEQLAAGMCCAGAVGSSPRVRGTARRCSQGVDPHRFIPACAGNSD